MSASKDHPEITAVICTYNRYDLLEKAVDSLLKQTLSKSDYEIFVVDNSPDPEKAKEQQRRYSAKGPINYIIEPIPGLSNARNVALQKCRGRYIAYLDDDAIARPQWLEKLIEGYRAFPNEAGVVGGKIDPIWEAPRPAWLPDSLLGCLTVVDWGGALRIASPDEWVAGANISFLTEALRDIGGFPTNLGRVGSGNILLSNEEIQILSEMRNRGLNVIYAPDAVVDHLVDVRRLDQSWIRRRMAWQAVSDFLKNAEEAGADQSANWNVVVDFFNSVPPRRRTIRGLFEHCDDPQEFERQVDSIYNVSMVLLGGINLSDGS